MWSTTVPIFVRRVKRAFLAHFYPFILVQKQFRSFQSPSSYMNTGIKHLCSKFDAPPCSVAEENARGVKLIGNFWEFLTKSRFYE